MTTIFDEQYLSQKVKPKEVGEKVIHCEIKGNCWESKKS